MHKLNWVWRYIFDTVIPETQRAVNAGSEIAGLILALAVVDYLAGYWVGRESTGADYIALIRRYFPPQYEPFAESIYVQLRNGLMHNLVGINPWRAPGPSFLIHPNHPSHLQAVEHDQIAFSVLTFLEDIRRAWIMFAHDLVTQPEPDAVSNFIQRFDRLDGRGAIMVKVPD
ncbi:MAG: hypothetical protein ABSB61_09715 [Anaerolineales bacterium]